MDDGKRKRSISVVVPAYNEGECIGRTITEIRDFLIKNFKAFEIIVVDDGSNDDTHKTVLQLSENIKELKVLKNDKNYGKGYSVKRGVFSALSEYIAFTDADLSTPISELNKFIDCLEGGAQIAIGSRALKASEILKKQRFLRERMGKVFNLLVGMFLFKGIKDTQCGFKCFKSGAARKVFRLQKIAGFCFDAEILYIAAKHKLKTREIPVKWANRESSKVSILGSSLNMLLDIFRIRINDRRSAYADK